MAVLDFCLTFTSVIAAIILWIGRHTLNQHWQDVINVLGNAAIPLAGCALFTCFRVLLSPYFAWKEANDARNVSDAKLRH